jgi:hypothetical protein
MYLIHLIGLMGYQQRHYKIQGQVGSSEIVCWLVYYRSCSNHFGIAPYTPEEQKAPTIYIFASLDWFDGMPAMSL